MKILKLACVPIIALCVGMVMAWDCFCDVWCEIWNGP